MPNEEALKNIGIDSKIVVDGFKWTDELVIEFLQQLRNGKQITSVFHGAKYLEDGTITGEGWLTNQFKQSKMKKEEPKEWEILTCYDGVNAEATVHDFIPANNHKGSEPCIGGIINCKIHSVKRLSDGEVFTVGDKINYKGINGTWDGGKHWCPVERFSIHEGDIYVNKHYVGRRVKISEWLKAPKEEPIPIKVEVNTVWLNEELTNNYTKGWYAYQFSINTSIHPAQFPLIKKAIESVLRGNEDMGNIETFNRGYSMGRYDASKYDQKQHSSEELLQARKEARKEGNDALKEILGWINAAISCRKVFPDEIDFDFTLKTLKEQTQDYINSLNK